MIHVYSAFCSWSGPIEKTGTITSMGATIPCCPFCKSVLYEMPEKKWQDSIDNHEMAGNMNYRAFVEWMETQPRCWPTDQIENQAQRFRQETGLPLIYDILPKRTG